MRPGFFIIAVIAALVAFVSIAEAFLPGQSMMNGGMMGSTFGGYMIWPSTLLLSGIVLILVTGYLLAFPAIRYTPAPREKKLSASQVMETPSSKPDPDALEVVMRVLKADEKAALEVLRSAGGKCLQKDITYKTGLSKLRTHRVVARLAERGVIQVRRVGKTNEITVPAWLKGSASAESQS